MIAGMADFEVRTHHHYAHGASRIYINGFQIFKDISRTIYKYMAVGGYSWCPNLNSRWPPVYLFPLASIIIIIIDRLSCKSFTVHPSFLSKDNQFCLAKNCVSRWCPFQLAIPSSGPRTGPNAKSQTSSLIMHLIRSLASLEFFAKSSSRPASLPPLPLQ